MTGSGEFEAYVVDMKQWGWQSMTEFNEQIYSSVASESIVYEIRLKSS